MISDILLGEIVPFLGALRILGWFPARLNPTTGTYEVCLKPIDVAYCIAVNSFVVLANFPTLYSGFQAILRTEEFYPLFAYGQTFGTVLSAFFPILFAMQTKSTVESLNGVIDIQVALKRRGPIVRKSSSSTSTAGFLVVFSLALAAFLFVSVVIILPFTVDSPNIGLHFSIGMAFAFGNLAMSWWLIIYVVISATVKQLSQQFEKESVVHYDLSVDTFYATHLLKLRVLAETVGNNSREIIISLSSASILLLLNVFELSGSIEGVEAIAFILFLLLTGASIIITLCEAAHMVINQISCHSMTMLKNVEVSMSSPLSPFAGLMIRLINSPLKISILKYIYLDRMLYMPFFSALFSLLVVLLQLNQKRKPLGFENIFSFN